MTSYPETTTAEEIRMTMRMHCRLPATMQVLASGLRVGGDVMDASETGLFFRTDVLFPVGTEVRIELQARGRGLAGMNARVVRVVTDAGECGMGLQFQSAVEPVSRFAV
jgi:hypothetical protein